MTVDLELLTTGEALAFHGDKLAKPEPDEPRLSFPGLRWEPPLRAEALLYELVRWYHWFPEIRPFAWAVYHEELEELGYQQRILASNELSRVSIYSEYEKPYLQCLLREIHYQVHWNMWDGAEPNAEQAFQLAVKARLRATYMAQLKSGSMDYSTITYDKNWGQTLRLYIERGGRVKPDNMSYRTALMVHNLRHALGKSSRNVERLSRHHSGQGYPYNREGRYIITPERVASVWVRLWHYHPYLRTYLYTHCRRLAISLGYSEPTWSGMPDDVFVDEVAVETMWQLPGREDYLVIVNDIVQAAFGVDYLHEFVTKELGNTPGRLVSDLVGDLYDKLELYLSVGCILEDNVVYAHPLSDITVERVIELAHAAARDFVSAYKSSNSGG